jgi:hypothetical protein
VVVLNVFPAEFLSRRIAAQWFSDFAVMPLKVLFDGRNGTLAGSPLRFRGNGTAIYMLTIENFAFIIRRQKQFTLIIYCIPVA